MKSMSMPLSGIERLYCVARWHQGFCRSLSALSHIFEGENVWHHVITPAHLSSKFAALIVSVASSGVFTVTLYTTLQGSLPLELNASAISCARAATVSSTSGPYRNWLPTTNQNS